METAFGSGAIAVHILCPLIRPRPLIRPETIIARGRRSEDYDAWIDARDRAGCGTQAAASRIPRHGFHRYGLRGA